MVTALTILSSQKSLVDENDSDTTMNNRGDGGGGGSGVAYDAFVILCFSLHLVKLTKKKTMNKVPYRTNAFCRKIQQTLHRKKSSTTTHYQHNTNTVDNKRKQHNNQPPTERKPKPLLQKQQPLHQSTKNKKKNYRYPESHGEVPC
jgi:uncharacterized spore protein YtfJ